MHYRTQRYSGRTDWTMPCQSDAGPRARCSRVLLPVEGPEGTLSWPYLVERFTFVQASSGGDIQSAVSHSTQSRFARRLGAFGRIS